jgi:hypothetical protein
MIGDVVLFASTGCSRDEVVHNHLLSLQQVSLIFAKDKPSFTLVPHLQIRQCSRPGARARAMLQL